MKVRINKRNVENVAAPEAGKRTKLYDDLLPGFGVAIMSSGKRSFFLEYGPKGRQRRMTLGAFGALTVEQARAMAQAKLAEIAQGGDPLRDKAERRAMPVWRAWVAEYLEGVRRRKKQPRHDERYLAQAVDRWGSTPVDQLTRREVQQAMAEQAKRGQTTANRWLASVRSCFEAARVAGLISENPAAALKAFREAPPRARVLDEAEFGRAVVAIRALPDPHVRAAFLILMETGARKSEVLHAKWEDFDLERGIWRIPSPKAGRPQVIPIGPSTVEILVDLPRVGPFVVPGLDPSGPREDLRGPWELIREAAGLEGVTIHDLRRTFGLHVARAAGLQVASKLLRHSDIRVTERVYVPLGLEDMREGLNAALGARVIRLADRK